MASAAIDFAESPLTQVQTYSHTKVCTELFFGDRVDSRLTARRLALAAVLRRSAPVSVTAVAAATSAFLTALALLVGRPLFVQKLAIPLVTWLLHPGRMVSPEGVDAIDGFFCVMAGMAGLVGGLTLGYALLWRYFSRSLPTEAAPLPRAMVSSTSTIEICCALTIFFLASLLRIHGITSGLSFDEITTAMYFVNVDSLLQIISRVKQYGFALLDLKDVLEIGHRTDQWLREFVERRARPEPMCGV